MIQLTEKKWNHEYNQFHESKVIEQECFECKAIETATSSLTETRRRREILTPATDETTLIDFQDHVSEISLCLGVSVSKCHLFSRPRKTPLTLTSQENPVVTHQFLAIRVIIHRSQSDSR